MYNTVRKQAEGGSRVQKYSKMGLLAKMQCFLDSQKGEPIQILGDRDEQERESLWAPYRFPEETMCTMYGTVGDLIYVRWALLG